MTIQGALSLSPTTKYSVSSQRRVLDLEESEVIDRPGFDVTDVTLYYWIVLFSCNKPLMTILTNPWQFRCNILTYSVLHSHFVLGKTEC